MEKLNEQQAIVTIHPTEATVIPSEVCEGLPIPAMEFFMDTTRTFVNMSQKKIFQRYPDIKWIVPHAGAFLPILSDRIQAFRELSGNKSSFFDDLKQVYFDVAGFAEPKFLEMLLRVAPAENLLYGSDYPHTPANICNHLAEALEDTKKLSEQEKDMIFTKNACKLLPFLAE